MSSEMLGQSNLFRELDETGLFELKTYEVDEGRSILVVLLYQRNCRVKIQTHTHGAQIVLK
jgi:hypothetical protein